MAIFSKPHQETATNTNTETTTIAKGTRIEGDITLECNLNMEGFFNGNIASTGRVVVGKTGRIEGKLNSDSLIVSGLIKGDIECNHIEILTGGKIEGNILTVNFIIENGGVFEGTSKIKDSNIIDINMTLDEKNHHVEHKKVVKEA